MEKWVSWCSVQLCNTLDEILSIPGDFSTSSKTRASKTCVAVTVIELRESCIDDRSFSRNTALGYEVSSHENHIVRGAAVIISVVNDSHNYYSKPRTFAA